MSAPSPPLRTAKRVWLATDCDREGQLIGQEILEHYEYRGQVMRVLFTAQDSQTIRDAFSRAKPNSEYARLYAAAVARRQADQIYNLSLTRSATVILGQGARRVIGVGRVKTPTLAIVCKRELEIRNFVPLAYFEVVATAKVAGGQFQMRHAPQDRIVRREIAQEIADAARGFEDALAVRVEDKRQGPPKLHDLPSLQKLCGSRFGWPASKTLEVAQELYDGQGKKIITYPRAEVRYLPQSLISDVPRIVAGLRVGQSFGAIPVPEPPMIRKASPLQCTLVCSAPIVAANGHYPVAIGVLTRRSFLRGTQAEGSKRSTEIFSIVLVTFGSVAQLIFCALIISILGPTGRHPIPRHPAARPDEPKLRQQLKIPKRT